MHQRTLHSQNNHHQPQDAPPRRRVEISPTHAVVIEDFVGLSVSLVGATQSIDYSESSEAWEQDKDSLLTLYSSTDINPIEEGEEPI